MKTSNVFLVIFFVILYVLLVYLPFTVAELSFDIRLWGEAARAGFAAVCGVPIVFVFVVVVGVILIEKE